MIKITYNGMRVFIRKRVQKWQKNVEGLNEYVYVK